MKTPKDSIGLYSSTYTRSSKQINSNKLQPTRKRFKIIVRNVRLSKNRTLRPNGHTNIYTALESLAKRVLNSSNAINTLDCFPNWNFSTIRVCLLVNLRYILSRDRRLKFDQKERLSGINSRKLDGTWGPCHRKFERIGIRLPYKEMEPSLVNVATIRHIKREWYFPLEFVFPCKNRACTQKVQRQATVEFSSYSASSFPIESWVR